MNSFSHIMIGSLLHKYIKDLNGVELHWASFIYGNLLPDFKPSYKMLPHEPESWERYIKSEINKLSSHRQRHPDFGPNYSRRLGIICHFYADFLCHPHTDAFEGGTYQHMKYEWELFRYKRKNLDALKQPLGSCMAEGFAGKKIYARFEALYEDYLQLEPCYENDAVYTLRACADLVSLITAHSVAKKELPVGGLLIEAAKG